MEDHTLAGKGRKPDVQKEAAKETEDKPLSKEVSFENLIWVKIYGSFWWPSQVVDEETVSDANKPSKKSSSDVLVRLYGAYKYLYVNCSKCRAEFEKVLMDNNGSYDKIFSKSLEEDLSRLKSGRSKRQGSKSKAINSPEKALEANEGTKQSGSRKKLFDNGTHRRASPRLLDVKTKPTEMKNKGTTQKPENTSTKKRKNEAMTPNTPESATTLAAKPHVLSERKVKVMQSLGLTAPAGSPFRQNGSISPSPYPL